MKSEIRFRAVDAGEVDAGEAGLGDEGPSVTVNGGDLAARMVLELCSGGKNSRGENDSP